VIFLRKNRPTLIAAVAIPASLIATFGAMAYMGYPEHHHVARPHLAVGSSSTTR